MHLEGFESLSEAVDIILTGFAVGVVVGAFAGFLSLWRGEGKE